MNSNEKYEGDESATSIDDQIGRLPLVEPSDYNVMISWSTNVSVTEGSGATQASGWPFGEPITYVPAGGAYLSC